MRLSIRAAATLILLAACGGSASSERTDPAAEEDAAVRTADSAAAMAAAPQPAALPGGVSAADVARGRDVFATVCGVCHGPDARGTQLGPALAADSSSRTASLDSAIALIRAGVPAGEPTAMPSYAAALDDSAIRAVAAYVVALRAR